MNNFADNLNDLFNIKFKHNVLLIDKEGIETPYSTDILKEKDFEKVKFIVQASKNKDNIYIEVFCNFDSMLKIKYENPKGIHNHKELLNGGNGYGKIIFNGIDYTIKNCGCEYGIKD